VICFEIRLFDVSGAAGTSKMHSPYSRMKLSGDVSRNARPGISLRLSVHTGIFRLKSLRFQNKHPKKKTQKFKVTVSNP